jgi:lysophospholipase L1-like esterase
VASLCRTFHFAPRALVWLACAVAALLCPLVDVGQSAAAGPDLYYFALGDSIASGDGLGDDPEPCRRSPQAYPFRVLSRLSQTHSVPIFRHLACNGAEPLPVTGRPTLVDQVNDVLLTLEQQHAPDDQLVVVSLTIGANAIPWTDLTQINALLCQGTKDDVRAKLAPFLDRIRQGLLQQLPRLLQARSRLYVVVTDYYDPVNPGFPFNCASDTTRIEFGIGLLNETLRHTLQSLPGTRVRTAFIHDAFIGHEAQAPVFCGSAPIQLTTWIQADCFHPNADGAIAIGDRVFDEASTALAIGGDAVSTFVAGFYYAVLARQPTASEVDAWDAFLRSQRTTLSASQMAHSFLDGPEYLGRAVTLTDFVTLLYEVFVGRAPDAPGLAGWVAHLQERFDSALPGFVNSVEFQHLLPNLGDPVVVSPVVRRLYQEVLGRQADPSEIQAWTSYITATGDVLGVARGFFDSREYNATPRTLAAHVAILYRTFLGRDPAPSEITPWVQLFQSFRVSVEDAFIGSPEFQAHFSGLF